MGLICPARRRLCGSAFDVESGHSKHPHTPTPTHTSVLVRRGARTELHLTSPSVVQRASSKEQNHLRRPRLDDAGRARCRYRRFSFCLLLCRGDNGDDGDGRMSSHVTAGPQGRVDIFTSTLSIESPSAIHTLLSPMLFSPSPSPGRQPSALCHPRLAAV